MHATAGREPSGTERESGEPEVIQLTDIAQLGTIIDEWRELASRIDGSSYFQTPDWVLSWWEDARRPWAELALWRSTLGVLDAVVCLAQWRQRLIRGLPLVIRFTTNLGSGRPHSADHCGWPVMPHRVEDVRRWVVTRHPQGVIVLQHLDQQTGVPLAPQGARRVLITACPRLMIQTDTGKAERSKQFRKRIGNYQRRLERMGVSFTWTPPEAMTVDAIDLLFTLSESRRSLKRHSSFHRERSADFHRRLVGWGGPGRGPAMTLAFHGGEPIGMIYGFVWRDTFYFYQGGWYAGWARFSLGTVLVSEAIRFAYLHGLRCYDFLRGAEPYKYRFGGMDKIDESWLLSRGIAGWLVGRKYQAVRVQRALLSAFGRHTSKERGR